jgi:hypothetical protein
MMGADADSPAVRTKALNKVRTVYRKTNGTRTHVWSMNSADWKEYVWAGPRPCTFVHIALQPFPFPSPCSSSLEVMICDGVDGMVLAFTALSESNKCDYCHSVHKQFMPLAELLHADATTIMATHYNCMQCGRV